MTGVFRLSKRLRLTLLAAALMLILLCLAEAAGLGQTAPTAATATDGGDDLSRAAFLAQYGWTVSALPEEVCDVTLPAVFDDVYTLYNQLQKDQGFDLSPYAGQTVKRITYRVLNHPQGDDVVANLLVRDGQVIGGDLCSLALDGFMHGCDAAATTLSRAALYEAAP